jgi:hypothetical protein
MDEKVWQALEDVRAYLQLAQSRLRVDDMDGALEHMSNAVNRLNELREDLRS